MSWQRTPPVDGRHMMGKTQAGITAIILAGNKNI
jgi:hypothetical protein